ncbi:MAG: MOSC domain-containing protein [Oscillospiraceae bacterium]|nr:MOSC domain-containing protein [Oscillospiraceae bacterium]
MNEPTVKAVCLSEKKGTVKTSVPQICVKENYGVKGDAHAGDEIKQVSLLADESVEKLRDKIPNITFGAFAENILTSGISLFTLPIGTKLCIGEAVLEIKQIGKECNHGACNIKQQTGDCCMPREGIFTKVLKSGVIKPGDVITVEN